MVKSLRHVFKGEDGQDLVEYCLLLGLIILASAALMSKSGAPITAIWTAGNTALNGGSVVTSHVQEHYEDN